MKERPILFNGEMVRAILEGRKTQTRRIVKEQERLKAGFDDLGKPGTEYLNEYGGWQPWVPNAKTFRCPKGRPGDRLWVRESWALVMTTAYRASEGIIQTVNPNDEHHAAIYRENFDRANGGFVWKPSIHMPRWASRINLEITNVRVERLQDISEEDAKAEGVAVGQRAKLDDFDYYCKECGKHPREHIGQASVCPGKSSLYNPWSFRGGFKLIWDGINAEFDKSWQANPWVWVIEFKKVEEA